MIRRESLKQRFVQTLVFVFVMLVLVALLRHFTSYDPRLIAIVAAGIPLLAWMIYLNIREPRRRKFDLAVGAVFLGMFAIALLYRWVRFGF